MNVASALVGLCLIGQISASGVPANSPGKAASSSSHTVPHSSLPNAAIPNSAIPNAVVVDSTTPSNPSTLNNPSTKVVGPSDIRPEKPFPGKPGLSPATEGQGNADDNVSPRRLRQPADTKTQPIEEEPLPTPAQGILSPKSAAGADRDTGAAPLHKYSDAEDGVSPPDRARQSSRSDQAASAVDGTRDTHPPRNDSRRAAELIGTALTPPRSGALEGQSLTLTDAIARRSDREGQIRLVHAYWKLAAAIASYHGALDEYQRTLEAEEPRSRETPGVMTAVRTAAKARMYETQVVAVAAQYELLELMRSGDGGAALPIPSDLPHVGLYATRFAEMFAGRSAPSRVRQIHQTLPTLYDAVQARAQSLAAAGEAVDAAQAALRKGEIAIDTWISRLAQLNQHRQAFLAIVRAYNDDIADYALTVAGEGTPATDLAAMLIRVKATSASTRTAPINTARDPRLDGIRRGYIPPTTGAAPFGAAVPFSNANPPPTARTPTTRDGFVPRGRSER